MIETSLNLLDCVVIGVMALSCLIAFFRGLVKEILSLVAWIGAGVITIYYFTPAAEWAQSYFKSPAVAAGASAIGLYIAALIGFGIVNMLILKTIRQGGETGMLDNTLGLVFGAARGAFIISLGFFLMTAMLPKDNYPEWFEEAATRSYGERGAAVLTKLAPDALSRIAALQEKAAEEAQEKWTDQDSKSEIDTGYRPQYPLDRMEPAR